jgi:hypothetical protein
MSRKNPQKIGFVRFFFFERLIFPVGWGVCREKANDFARRGVRFGIFRPGE